MKGIVIELYKDITKSSSAPIKDENFYKVLGHFDHFCCKATNSISNFADYEPVLQAGHDSQIMYLFNYDNNDNNIKNTPRFFEYKSTLPIRVLTLIQTKNEKYDNNTDLKDRIIKKQKIVNNIVKDMLNDKSEVILTAEIYYTLGCTDLAVIIDTNRLALVPDLLGRLSQSISHSSSLYSIIGFSNNIDDQDIENIIYTSNELELSLRLTLNQNNNQSVTVLEEELNKLKCLCESKGNNVSYTITKLLGNYDLLVLIDTGACYVLGEIVKHKGNFNVENSLGLFGMSFDRVRPTLRFKKYDDLLQGTNNNEGNISSDDFEKEIIVELRNTANELFNEFKNCDYTGFKKFSTSLKSQLEQLIIFCNCIRENYTKNVNPEFWEILSPTIRLFSIILSKHNSVALQNEKIYDGSLQSISYFVSTLSEYLSNLLHLHRYFLEERGIFDFNISSNTKLLIAYNQFANIVKELLLSAEYKDGESHREIAIYITSKLDSKILSSKLFNHLENFDINDSLININIPTSCLFNVKENLSSIIHEVAHFVGPRNRRNRSYALIKTVCKVVSVNLFSTFYSMPFFQPSADRKSYEAISKDIKRFYSECSIEKLSLDYLDKFSDIIYEEVKKKINANLTDERSLLLANLKNELVDSLVDTFVLKNNEQTNYIFDKIAEIQRTYDNEVWKLFNSWVNNNRENFTLENKTLFHNWLTYYYPTDIRNARKKEDIVEIANFISTVKQNQNPRTKLKIASIENIINCIFDGTSEAFCDLMMIKTLDMSALDYYEIVKNITALNYCDAHFTIPAYIRLILVKNKLETVDEKKEQQFIEKINQYFNNYMWVFNDLFIYFDSVVADMENINKNKVSSLIKEFNNKDNLLQELYDYSFIVKGEERNE